MSSAPRTPATRIAGAGAPVSQPATIPSTMPIQKVCQHPRVQIVAREEDAEFVECLECREVFEASEFRDMAIEEKIEGMQEQ